MVRSAKFFVGVLVLLAFFSLAACGRADTTSSTSNNASSTGNAGGATVHMSENDFVQSSVTISKGSRLTLVDDAADVHIITNGTWKNGTPDPRKEDGAPTVNVTFQGDDTQTIGPFNTAGTFQFYCTVHPGMNLNVIVK